MNTTTKWVLVAIVAAILGGGSVALLGNSSSAPSNTQQSSINAQTAVDRSKCVIKGNISSSGEKIYHMPNQKFYDVTKIDTSAGERMFCTEEEAISAGWRKSKV